MNPGTNFLKLKLLSLGYVLALACALTGCSVDMFSKAKSDAGITGGENYRAIRPECSRLKLVRPELDPATFRKLIQCFAANGSIPEIATLVSDASEETIRQTVDLLNATFLADPDVRAQSRGIVRSLKRNGRWDATLAGFAPVFGEPARIHALIRLLSLGNRDPLIVKTVQSFDSAGTLAGFELFSRLAKTPAFGALARGIQTTPLTIAERDRLLEILVDSLHRSTPNHSANLLLGDMSAGKSASLWSFAFGEGTGILDSTSRFEMLLRDFAGPDGLRPLTNLHRGFHHAIRCWGDGKVFPDPWQNLSHELSIHAAAGETSLLGFVSRFAPLTALGIPELCPVPDEFLDSYPSVMRLTSGRTGGEYLGLLKHAFAGEFGVSAGYFVGEWGDPLNEVLTLLQAKPWFGDLVLLFGELDAGDRDLFAGWMKALLANREAWTGLTRTWTKSDLDPVFADLGQILGTEPGELAQILDSIGELFESARIHPWFEGWKRIAAESDSNGMRSLTDLKSFPEASAAIGRMAGDGRLAAILGDVLELLAGGDRGETNAVQIEPEALSRKVPRHSFIGMDLHETETWAPLDDSLRACLKLDLRKAPRDQWDVYQACLLGESTDAKALAGFRLAEDWTIIDGNSSSSFLDSLTQSLVKLPLTTADKHEIIGMITGKESDLPAITSGAVQEALAWIREEIGMGTHGAPTAIFQVLNRFQTDLNLGVTTWQDFFTKIERMIEDSRFVPLARAVRAMVDPATAGDTAIAPAPLPPAIEAAAWVRDLECERDAQQVATRVDEIGREFSQGVLGWERPGGKIPLKWDAEMLRPRMDALAESLSSPELRAGLYAWLASLDPKAAAKWFADRAGDPKLVAVMDPETKQLRVRWMTSLDRLESILVNSNFTYLLSGNYGLKFISKFAEAWGDEPRSRWPKEIQNRYTGKNTPPTLADVYGEVTEFVRLFEKFGGIPSVQNCGVKDAPDLLIPFSVKAKAFNLKQTLSVIHENLPGSGTPHADGMRLLRDLFWAVESSAPRADRDAGKPERNPLRFLQRLGDLGGLRSMSRGLQSFDLESERLALEDAFGGLRVAVSEPALDHLVTKIIDHPASLDAWVNAAVSAPQFRIGTLAFGALSSLAADRTLGISPVLIRFADSILGEGALPDSLIADTLLEIGKTAAKSPRLHTLRLPDSVSRGSFMGFGDFLESRLITAIRVLPLPNAVSLLDHDPVLRSQLMNRQSTDVHETSSELTPYLDLFLSTEHPELRHAISLWCGSSAGRYAFELSSRPDESLLMIDGLLQFGRGATFADFLDSLMRELPD